MATGKQRIAVTLLTVSAALLGGGGVVGLKTLEGKGPVTVEGKNAAYVDRLPSVPVVTVCYGHTATAKLGQEYTDAQCDTLLLNDLEYRYAPAVRRCISVPLTQNEFNALVDFTYNVGATKACGSTLFKLVNQKQYDKAALEFPKWKYVGGKDCSIAANKCGGIPKRRAWEAQLFAS